jgi:hypothetical protein
MVVFVGMVANVGATIKTIALRDAVVANTGAW